MFQEPGVKERLSLGDIVNHGGGGVTKIHMSTLVYKQDTNLPYICL